MGACDSGCITLEHHNAVLPYLHDSLVSKHYGKLTRDYLVFSPKAVYVRASVLVDITVL